MKYKENKNPRYEKIFYFNKVSRPKSKIILCEIISLSWLLFIETEKSKLKKILFGVLSLPQNT